MSLICPAVMPNFIARANVWISSSPAWPTMWAPRMRSVASSMITFGPGGGLVVGLARQPIDHVVRVHLDLVAELRGLRFRQTDAGERRNGVDAGRNAGVVGLGDRPFHDVAADDAAFIGSDRGELRRAPKHVAAHVNSRIRGRTQMLVRIDASASVPDASGFEIQRVHIGDAPGAVDDAIGLELMLGTVMLECHAQAASAADDVLDRRPGPHLDADPLAFGANLLHRVGIHGRKQVRQDLENGDLRAGTRMTDIRAR